MSLLNRFTEYIKQAHLFSSKDKLLLAVSGGVDSVVLCELCKQAGYDFMMAHCNFQLRGEESERDEQFVNELSKKYNVNLFVKKFDTEKYAADCKMSIQEAARKLRYEWFAALAGSQLSANLLTAHHADDNIETLLMNFFRGTGLHGLTGIPEKAGMLRRPLLHFSKEELIAFAKEHGLPFVEDSSNASSKYTRNFFRNEIIPAITKVYPQVKNNLQDNIHRFRGIGNLYQFTVGELKKKICRVKGKEVHIPVKQLMEYNSRALIYEIIKDFGFAEKQVDEVLKLADSNSGKYIISPDKHFHIIKHRHWFIISPALTMEAGNIVIEKNCKEVQFPMGAMQIKYLPAADCKLPATNLIARLDAKHITFPLLLRKWKTGDYFYPLGMRKKKKVARFLIDLKLSKTEKEKRWVLESGQHIIWVVGHRIDERFKITGNTKEVLQLTLIP